METNIFKQKTNVYVDMVTLTFKQKTLRRYGNDYLQTEDYVHVDIVTIVFKQKTIRRYGNDYPQTKDYTQIW